jgi:SAM-dependent methyltransferase
MRQSSETEILDAANVPEHLADRAYRDLTRIHLVLGDTRAIVAAIRRDPLPVRRVLDIGCAHGGVLRHIQRRLAVDVVGVDRNPSATANTPFLILRADAIQDHLPAADVAFSMLVAHHLAPGEVAALIRNVGRSCRRFILLDLVRHRLPLALFRVFVAPLVSPIVRTDGCASIRRAYTSAELSQIAREALRGTGADVRHSVAPFYVRQILDITWSGSAAGSSISC